MTYPDSSSQIAHSLRLWRERAGLRQVEAAQSLGVCQTTISSWEKGRTSIDWRYLRLLAYLYQVSAQELGAALLGRDQAAAAPASRVMDAAPPHLAGMVCNWTEAEDIAGRPVTVARLAAAVDADAHVDWAHDGERITANRLPDGRFAFGIAEYGDDEE